MFGTLHWNSHTKEAEFVERPHGSSNPEMHSACDRCRAKKVMSCESGSHTVSRYVASLCRYCGQGVCLWTYEYVWWCFLCLIRCSCRLERPIPETPSYSLPKTVKNGIPQLKDTMAEVGPFLLSVSYRSVFSLSLIPKRSYKPTTKVTAYSTTPRSRPITQNIIVHIKPPHHQQ